MENKENKENKISDLELFRIAFGELLNKFDVKFDLDHEVIESENNDDTDTDYSIIILTDKNGVSNKVGFAAGENSNIIKAYFKSHTVESASKFIWQ